MDNANLVKQLKEVLDHLDNVYVAPYLRDEVRNVTDAKNKIEKVIKQLELGIDDGR